jgi:tetratricopeptide (TPR) repeat protein
MDELVEILRYLKEHPEVTWSGAGLTVLAVLYFLITKLFAPLFRKDPVPPVGSTFTHSGSGAVGKKVKHINASGASIGVLGKNAHVEGGIHHHYYDRTEQGIPLQRPKQAEYLVGREELLNDVLGALRPGRVVTLCGPGGIGKTALASRVAWELAPEREAPALFPDGLLFSSFYGRKDVGLAFDHLVRSYNDDAQDNSPEAVCRLLANKQALIILDGAEEADDLPAVLRCCGGCGVLITSRKRSDAPGKLLEVKALDKLPAEEAFRLYSRGTACCAPTTADEATVRAICQQLGGWPLALRLAGHYLRNTGESAADYLRFLSKVPFQRLGSGEHQDENAALLLRRSMDQVSEDARLALAMAGCLAFAPMGREPLMALLESDELQACNALNELVVYGLLERQGQRWQISHALIHTYARKELALSRDALKRLAWTYIYACQAASKDGVKGYIFLDKEREHCQRLIESCLERELWQEVKDLAGAIWEYLDRQGWWTEQLAALEMRLTAARQAGDRKDEAMCLGEGGYTCLRCGVYDVALMCFEQSLTIDRELGDRHEEGTSLNNIGMIYRKQGKYEPALQTYQQSLTIAQEIGDQEGKGTALNNIGAVYYCQGDHEQALQYYEQCLPIRQEVGDKIGVGQTLNNIAAIYHDQGDLTRTVKYLEQDLAICRELGNRDGEARSCWNIGLTYEDLGDLVKAEEYITLTVEIAEAISHPELEKYRDGLEQVRATLNSRWWFWLYKGEKTLLNWLQAKRQGA